MSAQTNWSSGRQESCLEYAAETEHQWEKGGGNEGGLDSGKFELDGKIT